ncbi:hypothetical protein BJ508DRAFT_417579 [Ascobolus immersus RN42]|uniref:DASH complex subunit DUO1 n=1 Tax=Ascobolus immersus RN42 TaxID=1160509 RepID=A0A3N4HTT0_ASCIM|nr:hypothetical protein BJ508DRAFT_417579 [Ascobolus immersus RN42]
MSDDDYRDLRSSSFTPIDIPPRHSHQSREPQEPQDNARAGSERPRQPRAHSYIDPEEREAALRAELEGVEKINDVIENVLSSLESAAGNMETVTSTITSANALLSLYTRILSQTEHTTRLLLNPNWQGITNDIASIEADRIARREAEERRRQAEIERQREAERKAAAAMAKREEERKKSAGSRRTAHGRVGGVGGTALHERRGATTTRSASGIGRGTGIARGVGRTRGTGIGRGARS